MNKPVESGPSKAGNALEFLIKHRRILSRVVPALLLLIIVLQNWEPTRVDVLFWSLPAVPKLVLILVSVFVGALGTMLALSWRAAPGDKRSGPRKEGD